MDEPRADPPDVGAAPPAAAPLPPGPQPSAASPPASDALTRAPPAWRALAERELPPRLAWLLIVGLSIGAGALAASVRERRQAAEDCRAACERGSTAWGAPPSCECPAPEDARALGDDRAPDPWPGRHGRPGR
ncbi:MAG: hypothetical protein IT376_18705 [Polyangiaceae bacterium]|nr:hypothetical protein [Polyangiaceae bacterium]